MSHPIRYSRLDGYGEDSVDLDQCRRFLVGRRISPGPFASSIDATTLCAYYLHPDGETWIRGMGGIRQLLFGGDGYEEVHPVVVAQAMLLYDVSIPPQLEPYRYQAGDG